MTDLPDHKEQIRLSHAALIHQTVKASQNIEAKKELEPMLELALNNGWTQLVPVLREIVAGRRDVSLLKNLDDEDSVIAQAVLDGLQNPASMPALNHRADPQLAAPGLAGLIHAASRGDTTALQAAAQMAEQMTRVGGDLGRLGGIMRRLINGERDAEQLCTGMNHDTEQLVVSLLQELGKLSQH